MSSFTNDFLIKPTNYNKLKVQPAINAQFGVFTTVSQEIQCKFSLASSLATKVGQLWHLKVA